jgi:hypothetical protein
LLAGGHGDRAEDDELEYARLNMAGRQGSRCAFTASASMPLGSGTGAYAGIGGSLNVHVTFAFVGRRFKSGTHKGQCNGNANPLAQMGTISGGGTVSIG